MIPCAFRAGAEATEWTIKKISTGANYVLHESSPRMKNYQEVTRSIKFQLNFFNTR